VKLAGQNEKKIIGVNMDYAELVLRREYRRLGEIVTKHFDGIGYKKLTLANITKKLNRMIEIRSVIDSLKAADKHIHQKSADKPESSAGYKCDICGKYFWERGRKYAGN